MRSLSLLTIALGAMVFFALSSPAQEIFGRQAGQELAGDGWRGFADVEFMLDVVLTFLLAVALGAAIGYHPRTRRVVDTVEDAEAPKVCITYSVVGALIGIMVVQFGLVVGFVVFGIGGLFRFRTTLPSTRNTGRLIFVTLIGLSAGLDLPHLAVLSTVLAMVLIYVMDSHITHRIEIKGLEREQVVDASNAYRDVLKQHQFHFISQTRNASKGRVTLICRTPWRIRRRDIQHYFEQTIPEELRGTVDWEII